MKKSYIKFLAIAVAAGLFLYSLYAALSQKQKAPPSNSGPTISVPAQKGGDVQVKDFTKAPVKALGDAVTVSENADYSIVYFKTDKAFIITILSNPPQKSRDEAEQALLDKLGIGFGDACNLHVSLAVPGSVDSQLAGKDYGLSFCPSGTPF